MQSPQSICTRHLPSKGGELTAPTRVVNLLGTRTPPRQAPPPSADAMQSPQSICTRHLPSKGGELTAPTRVVNLLGTRTPPRQASPPGADAMQSSQSIRTRHLLSGEGNGLPLLVVGVIMTSNGISSLSAESARCDFRSYRCLAAFVFAGEYSLPYR